MKKLSFGAIAVLAMLMVHSAPALAQCENAGTASAAIDDLANEDTANINKYITQEENFVTEDLTNTATYELMARLDEFDTNLRGWLTDWWKNRLYPVMKDMTKQISASELEQTRTIAQMMDAKALNEKIGEKDEQQVEARKRFQPTESVCVIDTMGPGQTKTQNLSRAIARGFALDDSPRRSNAKGSISATGRGSEIKAQWKEYTEKFCDPKQGDQGCTKPGIMAGKNRDIPLLLWGDRQTIDMKKENNRLMVKAALRTLISPESPDPIPAGAVNSPAGREAILKRRAEEARLNAIYNAMGSMVGERIGGSGVKIQSMSSPTKINASESTEDASYSAIRKSMARDRFTDPQYVARMITNPQSVVREQGAVNAVRLQLMNDIYRRAEEMLFMAGAAYAHDLDKQVPATAEQSAPLR